jgi:hypothetical protein
VPIFGINTVHVYSVHLDYKSQQIRLYMLMLAGHQILAEAAFYTIFDPMNFHVTATPQVVHTYRLTYTSSSMVATCPIGAVLG